MARISKLARTLSDRAYARTEASLDVYLRHMATGDAAGAARALTRAAAWSAVTLTFARLRHRLPSNDIALRHRGSSAS